MAIKYNNAIRTARSLLGTPYSTYDCIGLIVQVIRRSAGGVSDYRCQGTNWLWDSINNSSKYKHLTERQESITGAQAGMLAFKRSGEDVHHVGLVTDEGTVIHSSSAKGKVVETALDSTWHLLGVHKYIETAGREEQSPSLAGGEDMESYRARVALQDEDSSLNVRNEPGTGGDVIGKLRHGELVTVQAEFDNGWRYVSYGNNGVGYVSGQYLVREEEPENIISVTGEVTIVDDAGNRFTPVGGWRVQLGGVD